MSGWVAAQGESEREKMRKWYRDCNICSRRRVLRVSSHQFCSCENQKQAGHVRCFFGDFCVSSSWLGFDEVTELAHLPMMSVVEISLV